MFMEKLEMDNTIKLTRVKLAMGKIIMKKPLLVIAFIFLMNILPSISSLFQEEKMIKTINTMNISSILFFTGAIVSLYMAVSYRTTNDQYSVYPQTDSSRFLSSQFINYVYLLFLAVASLVVYFLQYGFYGILAATKENIFLAYKFNMEYVIVGFLIFLIYLSLITAGITLVAVLLRKYRVYAFVAAATAFSLIMYNDLVKSFFTKGFGLIVNEKSITLFMIKGILLWLLIMITSFLINKKTVYYRTEKSFSKPIVAVIVVVVFYGLIIIPQMFFTVNNTSNTRISSHHEIILIDEALVTELDISHIPINSTIEVETMSYEKMQSENMYIEHIDTIVPLGKLEIVTRIPRNSIDGIDLNEFINPEVLIKLGDNKLYIDYIYDENVKVVILSPWLFMYQFDRYIGQGVFKEIAGSSSSRGSGHVRISTPEGINLKLPRN